MTALTHTPAHTTEHPDRFEDEETGSGYSVFQDTDAEDPRTNIPDEHAALWAFCEPRLSSSVASEKPEGNIAIDAFARYYERYDAEISLVLTQRYLRAYHQDRKIAVAIQTIRGYSQSDWLEVVAVVADGYGTAEDHIGQFRQWAFGDVWTVVSDSGDALSGIYADDAEAAVAYFRAEHEQSSPRCDRHGGLWCSDATCEGGTVRPTDDGVAPEGEDDRYRDLWASSMPRCAGRIYLAIPGEQPIHLDDDLARRVLVELSRTERGLI